MRLAVLLVGLLGCGQTDLVPVPGTTVRVAPPTQQEQGKNALELHIFSTEEECYATVKEDDVPLCLPYVDRASGQVRVSFQMRVDGDEWKIPLSDENIEIFHKNQRVLREGRKDFQIVPHEPARADQLFILLIDSSGSMSIVDEEGSGRTRMDKLRAALLRNDVVDSFFPGDVKTAVVPLIFKGSGVPEPLGGKWIVDNKKDFRQLIKNELQVGSGFTYFYNAVDWSTSTLLENPEIKRAVEVGKQAPTIIALTDGFNNELPADVCADNAPRLEKMLKRLDGVRRGEVDVRYVPTVYTVGLGRSAWKGFAVPDDLSVSPKTICKGFAQQVINGGVETRGVDNAALSWIARVGGGSSFISRTTEGLADAFKAAAAVRFRWFEARYKVDPFYLRRSFETKLRLSSLLRSEGAVWIHPSGWYDAPPGVPGPDGWTRAAPFRETTTILLPVLGLLAALGYLPAAWFNVRRALFSRVARRRKAR